MGEDEEWGSLVRGAEHIYLPVLCCNCHEAPDQTRFPWEETGVWLNKRAVPCVDTVSSCVASPGQPSELKGISTWETIPEDCYVLMLAPVRISQHPLFLTQDIFRKKS